MLAESGANPGGTAMISEERSGEFEARTDGIVSGNGTEPAEEFVESLRLDDFVSDFEKRYPPLADGSKVPLVLKIDVEGHTCQVAAGIRNVLKNFNVIFVMMEW